MIVIIDYNIGNLQSVKAAFLRLGQETVISRDLEEIHKADALILPGVGAFPTAMNNLKKFNLIELIQERWSNESNFLHSIWIVFESLIIQEV